MFKIKHLVGQAWKFSNKWSGLLLIFFFFCTRVETPQKNASYVHPRILLVYYSVKLSKYLEMDPIVVYLLAWVFLVCFMTLFFKVIGKVTGLSQKFYAFLEARGILKIDVQMYAYSYVLIIFIFGHVELIFNVIPKRLAWVRPALGEWSDSTNPEYILMYGVLWLGARSLYLAVLATHLPSNLFKRRQFWPKAKYDFTKKEWFKLKRHRNRHSHEDACYMSQREESRRKLLGWDREAVRRKLMNDFCQKIWYLCFFTSFVLTIWYH